MALKILMLTNTYLPHVGGVARSVHSFAEALRKRGHRVVIVAPTFEGTPRHEAHVIRVPAIQNFNGSDFSVRLPVPGLLTRAMESFQPDIIHSHHPFLLGDTALRLATWHNRPLVFTHHTMYEQYTHYVPGDSPAMKHFVIRLATDYCNLCDHVIAPSESIRDMLHERGVRRPTTTVPTGIDANVFGQGDGSRAREQYDIPTDAFVIGHVGRLAPEKNLSLLAHAAAGVAKDHPQVHVLIVGSGPSEPAIREAFREQRVADRLHLTGSLKGQSLVDAYHAMNLFGFASMSETQGMVLAEAMTAGVPVVAIDAPGAREVVVDGATGRLLPTPDQASLRDALADIVKRSDSNLAQLAAAARERAEAFSLEQCTQRLIDLYEEMLEGEPLDDRHADNGWTRTLRMIETEWNLWNSRTEAVWDSLRQEET
ncbi:glycosyltransferase [Phycisphaerales bacterium AB-hyl4]|uniref:Glycosyltransferase n=1 Tax=Natronomicrosphaera hydrolytica TaxID=3242702 RepID=A0ABV4U7T0_9BACT